MNSLSLNSISSNSVTKSTRSKTSPSKPSVASILATDTMIAQLSRTKTSLTKLYPKASDSTKDFILQIEREEQNILDKLKHRKHELLGFYYYYNNYFS